MSIRVTHLGVAALTLLLVIVPLPSSVSLVSTAHAAGDTTAEADFVQLINEERKSRGLSALQVASDLVDVARSHSGVMASQNSLHHNPTLASDVENWQRLSENVGVGYSTAGLHRAFMDSTGHRANILDSKATEIGVGIEVRDGRVWVTEIFRLPIKASTSAASTPTPAADVTPLSGDWDGNGTVTPGWYVDGRFTLSNRADGGGTQHVFTYGTGGDLPLVGDWDGDGTDTVGIVRDGEWHLINRHSGGRSEVSFHYGRVTRGDIPLTGDWDGDGVDTPGIVRDGEWHLINHFRGGASQLSFHYGRITRGDIPLTGDWDGDGVDTAGIIRDGEWHLNNAHRGGAADVSFTYGRISRGDLPVVGDWDSDADTNVAIIRDGMWHYRLRHAGGNADWSHRWAAPVS